MGNKASNRLRRQIETSKMKQSAAAEKLRHLSDLVREEHQKFQKAKMASSAVGVAGAAVALVGGLMGGPAGAAAAVGAAASIIGGAGELAIPYVESKVLGPKVEEAQEILNQIVEETLELVIATNRKISRKKDAIDFEDCFKNNVKIVNGEKYGRDVTRAVAIINKTLEAKRLSEGIPNQQFDICDISVLTKGKSADKVRRGVNTLKAIKTAKAAKTAQSAGKVARSTGKVAEWTFGKTLTGLGLVLDIKSMIDNILKMEIYDSDVAVPIMKMADVLSRDE